MFGSGWRGTYSVRVSFRPVRERLAQADHPHLLTSWRAASCPDRLDTDRLINQFKINKLGEEPCGRCKGWIKGERCGRTLVY
jgi:hypothetical protein